MSTHGTLVAEGGVWAYDVRVLGRSVAQIGWIAAGGGSFDPHEGQGVGDVHGSIAFDGERRKLWAGPTHPGLDYGRRWNRGEGVGVAEGTVATGDTCAGKHG